MARSKNPENDENVQDVNIYPEGYEMNSWNDRETRGMDIVKDRSRPKEFNPSSLHTAQYKGRLYFDPQKIPQGWKYAFMTERLLNEPQYDNLQMQYENGWDFIPVTDHPDFSFREIRPNTDNRLRRANTVMMKKPEADYERDQKSYMDESTQRQKEICFNDIGNSPHPQFVVENSGSYTPSYQHKRG